MFIDFIPLPIYTPIFNYSVLILIIIAISQGYSGGILKKSSVDSWRYFGLFFITVLIPYMGLRPISGVFFGDTSNYASSFWTLQNSLTTDSVFTLDTKEEWLFEFLNYIFAKYSDVHMLFLFCSTVYVVSLWIALKRLFGDYIWIPFLVAISMFTFWSYGVNGVRNGMASSLIILALSYRNKLWVAGLLAFLAFGIHKSMQLTIGAAVLAYFYKNTRHYLYGWIACIALSLVAGGFFESVFISLGLGDDDRFAAYLTSDEFDDSFSSTGFRIDFLLYSAIPVMVGYYFIIKRKWNDEYYRWLYAIYLTTNGFWILVIRASFSNRFAQISWFIMPLVLIYPFYKHLFWSEREQSKKIGMSLIIFYMFTFYLNIIKS
ncbi:MAG: EpsG family protein [Bacteroidales bacterium]